MCKLKFVLLVLLMLGMLLLTGCALRIGQAYAGRTTVIGLSATVDPASMIPRVDLGYINSEHAVVTKDHSVKMTKNYEDVDLFEAGGSINTNIEINNK